MNPFNLFFQISMIVIAITIGVLYINPTLKEIKITQADSLAYTEEISKVSAVNNALADKIAYIDNLSLANKQALLKYLPDKIDEVSVLKDLKSILSMQSIEPKTLIYKGTVDQKETVDSFDDSNNSPNLGFITYQFEITADITYTDLKGLLKALEINNYPLSVTALTINPSENGFLAVDISLATFSRQLEINTVSVPVNDSLI